MAEATKSRFGTSLPASACDPKADLARERAAGSFDAGRMAEFLFGAEALKTQARLLALMENDPALNKDDRYYLGGGERYKAGLRAVCRLIEIKKEQGLSPHELRVMMRSLWGEFLPFNLHTGMFTTTLKGQCTDEQKARWLPLAENFEILGTYAQTELGHGTFLRGLLTTATYDAAQQQFIIHSPCLEAAKWWPGGLGKTATHAIVMARLFLNGRDLGPHPFMMQLRSTLDHSALPGITLGSIGPKMGFHAADNGYILFDHVRIPREQMLMRFSAVSADGQYTRPPAAKASYATMVWVRAMMIRLAASSLAQGLTIAVRYNAVRRQGLGRIPCGAAAPSAAAAALGGSGDDADDGLAQETAVLEYRTSQHALLPLIATAYALHFTGRFMSRMYDSSLAAVDRGDFSALPGLHATGAGLKALVTLTVSDGLERCRKTLGGHGYSLLSGAVSAALEYVPACTYEGENTVMALQTSRFLVKTIARVRADPAAAASVDPEFSYILQPVEGQRCAATTAEAMADIDTLLAAFRHRAAALAQRSAAAVAASTAAGASAKAAWDCHSVALARASSAHCHYVILRNFAAALCPDPAATSEAAPPADLLPLLRALCSLYGLSFMLRAEDALGEFMGDGYLSPAQVRVARAAYGAALAALRPQAVLLVDSFAIPDYQLCSALGSYDGDVYNRLFAWAQRDPLNSTPVPPGYREYLQPLLRPTPPPATAAAVAPAPRCRARL